MCNVSQQKKIYLPRTTISFNSRFIAPHSPAAASPNPLRHRAPHHIRQVHTVPPRPTSEAHHKQTRDYLRPHLSMPLEDGSRTGSPSRWSMSTMRIRVRSGFLLLYLLCDASAQGFSTLKHNGRTTHVILHPRNRHPTRNADR